ncbi:MAG TPA: type 1 glutamine amidotransferase domain-containing protein [Acidimicrobiales bacterium]
MANTLSGRRIAILAARGVEQVELTDPRQALTDAGAETELLSVEEGEVQAVNHDIVPADRFPVDRVVSTASVGDYDALFLPGGAVNPDTLRQSPAAVDFVREFVNSGKPVGVICHGPWTLVEADVVRGRSLASWPSLATDIANAGGTRVDAELVVDTNGPNTLVSSRNPGDLTVFCPAIVEEFAR